MSDYQYPSYGMAQSAAPAAPAAEGAGAAAVGSGINWGQAGLTAGASALPGIISMIYQAEQARKKKIDDLHQQEADNAGKYGSNQQNMLQQMMSNWNTALGGRR